MLPQISSKLRRTGDWTRGARRPKSRQLQTHTAAPEQPNRGRTLTGDREPLSCSVQCVRKTCVKTTNTRLTIKHLGEKLHRRQAQKCKDMTRERMVLDSEFKKIITIIKNVLNLTVTRAADTARSHLTYFATQTCL